MTTCRVLPRWVWPLLPVCFLAGCGTDTRDPLAKLTALVRYYQAGNDTPLELGENSATTVSNRDVSFGLSNYTPSITRVTLTRLVGGVSTTCDVVNAGGKGTVAYRGSDWPASDTTYTLTAHSAAGTREFGPWQFAVQPANALVTGSVHMGDQGVDANGYGPFFQSRHVGWGGGWVDANGYSQLVDGSSRLVDFATLKVGAQLRVVSPDDIQSLHTFDRLVDDCWWQKTRFELYTGSADPETAPPTLDQLDALPDPTQSSLAVADGTRFVYRTGEGKKGLVKLKYFSVTNGNTYFDAIYAVAQ